MTTLAKEDFDEESKSVVQINELKLDRECVRLPGSYLQWAVRAAEARQDVDELKAELSVVEADVGKRIRDNPGKFGLEKITENSVKEATQRSEDVQEKTQEYNTARHNLAMIEAVVSALDIKKKSLALLVELHVAGYGANVKMSSEGRDAVKNLMAKRLSKRED